MNSSNDRAEHAVPDDAVTNASLRDRVQRLRLPADMDAHRDQHRAWLPWSICSVLGLSTLVLGLQAFARTRPETEPVRSALADADTDAVASSGSVVLECKGYIIPAHQIQVSPKVSGLIVSLFIEEGKKVKEGEVLAVLEKTNYEASAHRARAALDAAEERLLELKNGNRPEEIDASRAALEEAKAQREQLYLDWKRNINLRTDRALATRDFELAESLYKAQARRVDKLQRDYELMVKGPRIERIRAADAEVRQAKAELVNADWNLDNCTIRAPVAGTILTKKAEKGNIVNSAAFNVSASLCDMADLSDLEVDLTVQERDIAVVFPGQPCQVRSEAYPKRVYTGAVSRLMPIADRAKGAISVRVKLADVPRQEEGLYLKPEMGVNVRFLKK